MFSIYHFIAYMANQTDFQTPSLKLQNIKLAYDMESQDTQNIWKAFSVGEIG